MDLVEGNETYRHIVEAVKRKKRTSLLLQDYNLSDPRLKHLSSVLRRTKHSPIADHSRVSEAVDVPVQVRFRQEPPLITS